MSVRGRLISLRVLTAAAALFGIAALVLCWATITVFEGAFALLDIIAIALEGTP